MKVTKVLDKMLCDYEVLQMLQVPEHLPKTKEYQDFRTMLHTVRSHLKNEMMPCSTQTDSQISQVLSKLPNTLTKLEKLMIINQRPLSMVELVVLIEDYEERFGQDQSILEILNEFMPFSRPVEEEEEE